MTEGSNTLDELLFEWDTHQVKHSCDGDCPSKYAYFDEFVKNMTNSVTSEQLFDFLAENPDVRISGQDSILSDFRSGLEKMGFPVRSYPQPLPETSTGVHQQHAPYYYRDQTYSHTSTRARQGDGINEVDPSANDSLENILGQILTTMNNIDKSLAMLVQSQVHPAIVVNIEPDNTAAPNIDAAVAKARDAMDRRK